jgi:hypothetical protein
MSTVPRPPIVEPGSEAFPILTPAQIDRLRPFGRSGKYSPAKYCLSPVTPTFHSSFCCRENWTLCSPVPTPSV